MCLRYLYFFLDKRKQNPTNLTEAYYEDTNNLIPMLSLRGVVLISKDIAT